MIKRLVRTFAVASLFVFAFAGVASAENNPFGMQSMDNNLPMIAAADEPEKKCEASKCMSGKCKGAPEMKCSGDKKCSGEKKCEGEKKCGGEKKCKGESSEKKCSASKCAAGKCKGAPE